MTLLAVGVSHRSAPSDMLESLAGVDAEDLAASALASPHVAEAMVVSTCNRVEVYCEVDRFHAAVEVVVGLLAKASGLASEQITALAYVHYDERAAQHLFEVAAGLDSMVVGEAQIVGQLRSALTRAQVAGTAGRELNEAAQAALRVGKKVRSQTGIDRSGANVVTVGLAEALDRMEALDGPSRELLRVLVLGAGALGAVAVAGATRAGTGPVTVASRTESRARALSGNYGATVAAMSDVVGLIADADIVICCTGAVGTVIGEADVVAAMARRPRRPLVVLDLALPHDSDPGITHIPRVARVDLADLSQRPEARADRRDIVAAERLVAQELDDYATARAARAVEPVLVGLRARGTAVAQTELQRLREKLPGLSAEQWAIIEQALRRTVNTLMHTPTVRIKELAADPDGQRYADAITSLFDLPVANVDQVLLPRGPGAEGPP
jgi:glutamyl-tRNA reductase